MLLLLLEGGTRLLGPHAPALGAGESTDRSLWVHDRTKGWFHRPGSSGRSDLGGPDQGLVRMNSLGLRGREVARRKEPGVRRVLVFGDSFAFGVGVDEDHVFAACLERLLLASHGGIEVVNMGVSGYSTDQEYILFQELGAPFAPDLVVLLACDNDFEGNLQDFAYGRYYKPWFDLGEGGALVLRGSPVPELDRAQRARFWLGEHSNLWNLARSRSSRSPTLQAALDLFQVGAPRPTSADPQAVMLALVGAFHRLAGGIGARFLLANTGHRGEKTTRFQSLREALLKEGVDVVGLEVDLGRARREHPERQWDFRDDTHWNVDSHRRAADVVYEHLRQHGMLEAEARPGALAPSHRSR